MPWLFGLKVQVVCYVEMGYGFMLQLIIPISTSVYGFWIATDMMTHTNPSNFVAKEKYVSYNVMSLFG